VPSAPAVPEPLPTGKLPRDVRPLGYNLELEVVPSKERFSGRARIEVELAGPSTRIWLHAKDLHVREARAEQAGTVVPAVFRQFNSEGLAQLSFARPLAGGRAVLQLEYDAAFDRQLAGLYAVKTEGRDYAFSQFEPVSARQAFPCFDEPAFKTPFDIALTIPAEETAISNAPELSSEPAGKGEKRVRFATTKPLPTYLVAFIVGPLDVVQAAPIASSELRAQPLPLRGVATAGQGARLRYALDHAAPLLLELERYFGIAYPYPKLDLIAVPDFSAGAMENAGAITFRESILMMDPVATPESQRRRYASITAHEMAHHWTGDLVTMPWWDDTWLNEAFATFMATHTLSAVHPEYHADVDAQSSVAGAMDGDSRASARKIRQPIESTHDIVNAFDGITYDKGAGVISMIERFLGPEIFRRGIQSYLREHAHGTANAADLLTALGRESGKDVAGPMGSFLDQVGVPLVQAEVVCAAETSAELRLRQSRYLPAGSQAQRDQRWQIPVCARYEVRGQPHESCAVLSGPEGAMPLEGGCPDWLMPNAGGAGYYRWSLDAKQLAKLRMVGFAKLSVREKLSVADSLRAGFDSGALPAESVFSLLPALAADPDRSVASAPIGLLRYARQYLLEPSERPALDRFARALYEPRLRQLGWQERTSDDGDRKLLRAEIIWFLADSLRDPAARAKLAKLGPRYLGKGAGKAAPDLARSALIAAVQDGDHALFDTVFARFQQTTDPAERDRLLGALCSVTDARSSKVLALSLDPVLHVNEVTAPIRIQLGDERTREAAWAFLEQHIDELVARLSKRNAGWLPGLAWPFCSAAMAERVQAFFAPRIEQLTGGPRTLAAAVEGLRLCGAGVDLKRAGTKQFFAAPSK
jgi:alanyl aminopeptidase